MFVWRAGPEENSPYNQLFELIMLIAFHLPFIYMYAYFNIFLPLENMKIFYSLTLGLRR